MNSSIRSPVSVRQALADDLPAVAAIEAECFPDPWSEDAFASSLALPHMCFLVAERSGDTVDVDQGGDLHLRGYVLAMALGIEGEIADIAVAPAARGQGIGGVLLDRVATALSERGVRTLFLDVRASNKPAQLLYASRGFVQVGVRRGFYRLPTEDALLLRRNL